MERTKSSGTYRFLKSRRIPGYGEWTDGDAAELPGWLGEQLVRQGIVVEVVGPPRPRAYPAQPSVTAKDYDDVTEAPAPRRSAGKRSTRRDDSE